MSDLGDFSVQVHENAQRYGLPSEPGPPMSPDNSRNWCGECGAVLHDAQIHMAFHAWLNKLAGQ